MGLLQRKTVVATLAPAYQVSAERTYLIIGLGNPGAQYRGTRHNIGFEVIDELARQIESPAWSLKKSLKANLNEVRLGPNRVLLCKPTTFMNDSGQTAQLVSSYYKLESHQIVAVYDELMLPFGTLRSRFGGTDAGHNGVKSLIEHLGENFGRLRVGIHNQRADKADTSDFVLAKFTKNEAQALPQVIREACAMLNEYIYSGDLPHDTRTVL